MDTFQAGLQAGPQTSRCSGQLTLQHRWRIFKDRSDGARAQADPDASQARGAVESQGHVPRAADEAARKRSERRGTAAHGQFTLEDDREPAFNQRGKCVGIRWLPASSKDTEIPAETHGYRSAGGSITAKFTA
ncbi:MAG: hypothetical protein H0X13_19265 [Ramlibacter sp.]|nr:hypothetical protein [Ramlibacter sp.]